MSKYRAVAVTVDGRRFDSKAEARRWQELQLRAAAGEISDLEHHVRYPLMVNGKRVAVYEADFVYYDKLAGGQVIEDVKGVKTPVYRLKKALLLACCGLTITEITA